MPQAADLLLGTGLGMGRCRNAGQRDPNLLLGNADFAGRRAKAGFQLPLRVEQMAMLNLNIQVGKGVVAGRDSPRLQILGQALHQGHRAVLAAGTADGQSQVGATFCAIVGPKCFDQGQDVLIGGLCNGIRKQELLQQGILPSEATQMGLKEGVGQKTHIEQQVGIGGNAVLETEADQP
jgi:hypothetical protein